MAAVPVEGGTLRLHRATGRGYVLVGTEGRRRRVYVGKFHSPTGAVCPEAIAEATRVLAEAQVLGDPGSRRGKRLTVGELLERWFEQAKVRFASRPSHLAHRKMVKDELTTFAGTLILSEFGPAKLQAFRSVLAAQRSELASRRSESGEKGSRFTRVTLNELIRYVVEAFAWAVTAEVLPETKYRALALVPPLGKGELRGLREPQPVRPVSLDDVVATLPHLSRALQAVVKLQLLTGARPSELLGLRGVDIDQSGPTWFARPGHHKNEHRGHVRQIALSAEAQDILRPFLRSRLPTAALFSPAEAERERLEKRHLARVTPVDQGNAPGTRAKERGRKARRRAPGETYRADSYRRAIARACADAGLVDEDGRPRIWTPYRLRHAAATLARAETDIEGAQHFLGQRDPQVATRYAEQSATRAAMVAGKVGTAVTKALRGKAG